MLTLHKAILRVGSSSHHPITYSALLKQLGTYPHHPHLSIHLPEKLCQVSCKQQLVPTVICNKRDTNSPSTDCRRLFIKSLIVGFREGFTSVLALHTFINSHSASAQRICLTMSESKD